MGKEIIMFGDIEIEKHKFWQQKNAISLCDINIDRTVASNKAPLVKKVLKILLGTKMMMKKLCFCVQYFQKRVHIQQILMKLNICVL